MKKTREQNQDQEKTMHNSEADTTLLKKTGYILKWEHILIVLFVLVNIINTFLSPHYLNLGNMLRMSQVFLEQGVIGLALFMLIVSGNIDLSCASILAVSASVFGVAFSNGVNLWVCTLLALLVGLLCGFTNGFIVTRTKLPSLLVTLITLSLYRGIAFIIMRDTGVYGFPEGFLYLGSGRIGNTIIPIQFVFFIVLAIPVYLIMHKTYIGKHLFEMGSNSRAAFCSGVHVDRITMILFSISGVVYSLAGVLLVSRIGSIRPNIATGFELSVISIIVFGGTAIFGGKGTFFGFLLSLFTIAMLRFGLGLINIPSQIMVMITGVILIGSILANNALDRMTERRIQKRQSHH